MRTSIAARIDVVKEVLSRTSWEVSNQKPASSPLENIQYAQQLLSEIQQDMVEKPAVQLSFMERIVAKITTFLVKE